MLKNITKLLKSCKTFQTVPLRRQARGSKDVEVFINGKPVMVPDYFTILQACKRENVTLPSFCYHDRLSVAGNCRTCLVQVEGWWKLQIACAVTVSKGMKIRTNSAATHRAQEAVLEFLLVDHPLDCPICDQGGECDLQDLTMRFGNDRTRFTDIHFEGKRALENNYLGPLIRAEMTRCIHCTRCIRFGSQVCGIDVLGTSGRGGEMLVGTYVDKMFLSELSGNIIDLCPVGALTSIPYQFKGRAWEVRTTNSIDVTDATGTNIVVNHRAGRILRMLPREHEEINQEWLSDKGRWAIDSLDMQRLVTPMKKVNYCLCPIDWDTALRLTASEIMNCCPDRVMVVAGAHSNVETLVTCKDLINKLGSEHTYVERDLNYTLSGADLRAAYSLNVNMKNIGNADRILLVGTNPRFEAPILNAWIRSAYRNNDCDIYSVGPTCEYNYHVEYLGDGECGMTRAAKVLEGAKKPLIFVGLSQFSSPNGISLMKKVLSIAARCPNSPDWGVVNIITREASYAGALEAGWKPGAIKAFEKCPPSVLISLGADELFYDWQPPTGCIIIYIGFQGDRGAELADIVLPGSAYTESGGVYLNMECRSQYATPAVSPPGDSRLDWKIVRALASYCGVELPYTDEPGIWCRMGQISPNFTNMGRFQQKLGADQISKLLAASTSSGQDKTLERIDIDMKKLRDYYCSEVFTFNSNTMIKAQRAANEYAASCYAPN